MNSPQAFFGQVLQTVAGQAFEAARFQLEETTMHQARGLFRYRKALESGVTVYVEYQLLHYQGGTSRFRVNLLRNVGVDARSDTGYLERVDTTLSKLIWEDFGVRQLSGPDHWWGFNNSQELGQGLAEATRLAFGFGIPWLEGQLKPGDE